MSSSVPEGWAENSVGVFVKSKSLGTTRRGIGLNNSLLIKMGNLSAGRINYNKTEYVENGEDLKPLTLSYGDFLFNTRNTPELVGKVSNFLDRNTKAVFDNNLLRLRFRKDIDSIYMGYLFNLERTVQSLKKIVAGTTSVAAIYWNDLHQLKIVIPPLPEQQKIAAILTSVDNVIETTQAQIDKLKDLKTGMMQELLTKGIGHSEFKDSPVGRIPVGWEVKRLRDLAQIGSSKRIHQSEYQEVGVPFYRSKEVIRRSKGLAIEKTLYISRDRFEKLSNKFGAPQEGDILVTAVGTIGVIYLVENREFYFKDGNLLWIRKLKPISLNN